MPDTSTSAALARTIDAILNCTSDGVLSIGADWRFTHVNPVAAALLHSDCESMVGANCWELFPDARPVYEPFYAGVIATGEPAEMIQFYEPVDSWLEIRAFPHEGGVAVYFRDVSTRMRAEAQQTAQHAALQAALNARDRVIASSQDVICTVDSRLRFVEVSERCLEAWGYTPEEIVGRHIFELVHPDDQAEIRRLLAGSSRELPPGYANRYLRKDGRVAHNLWAGVWCDEDKLFYFSARDITERVRMEEEVRQGQRLETVGRLTGGIAHDFNNLLTVIGGHLEIIAEDEDAPLDDLRRAARCALKAADRASALVQHMLSFARAQPLAPTRTDIGAIVEETGEMLRRTLPASIRIQTRSSPGLFPVMIDAGQLENAILNLAINARDAMPDGGLLSIEARNTPDPGFISLVVTDTGQGMDAATASRAFEPFFTTKEVGLGSGLGLSMVHGFANQSGGRVELASEPGKGTVITLLLPRGAGVAAAAALAPQALARPTPATGRVLVVEDDDLVREQAIEQLTRLGYTPTGAADGREALARLEGDDGFELMFSDITMPGGIDGVQLAALASRLKPDLRVLLTTGYVENAGVRREIDGVEVLRKPYRRAELAGALQRAMARG